MNEIDKSFQNHRGRPGKVGGSLPKEGASSFAGKTEKERTEKYISNQVKLIWDKNFPNKKVDIKVEYKDDKEGRIEVSTEFSSKGFLKGDTVMMSVIDTNQKTITHEYYFLDDNRLKRKGFATSQIKYLENLAKSKGCETAILQASDQGRWTWPKLGFKCSSRKQFLEIVTFGKTKGIEIKSEHDFEKLEKYFTTDKKLKDDILMKKKVGVFPEKPSTKVVKEKAIQDKDICPVCGHKLRDSSAGVWCVNPKCHVLDDADNYR